MPFLHSNHHHHHIALVARISLTLSRHSSLSFIALGRSSGQHLVSSHSCWMYVRAGRPAFVRPCVGIHRSTSLMSSSLLLQQCPACLVRLTWIVFVIGSRWPYSWCNILTNKYINCKGSCEYTKWFCSIKCDCMWNSLVLLLTISFGWTWVPPRPCWPPPLPLHATPTVKLTELKWCNCYLPIPRPIYIILIATCYVYAAQTRHLTLIYQLCLGSKICI